MRKQAREGGARHGFTLIELLVVIAIIAILAAILFPVFAKAREKARTSSCSSNAKQIALAIMQYTQDYDERWPGAGDAAGGRGWVGRVYPYMKSAQVVQCPSDQTSGSHLSYCFNKHLAFSAQAIAACVSPSMTVMLVEITNARYPGGDTTRVWDPTVANEGVSNIGVGPDYGGPGWINAGLMLGPGRSAQYATGTMGNPPWPHWSTSEVPARHTDGSNFAFADGHVKWLKGSAVSPGHDTYSGNWNGGGGYAAGVDAGMYTFNWH